MEKEMSNEKLLNKFAEAQHKIWANWMEHLFEQGWDQADGTFKIKSEKVRRWKRQIETPYEKLSDEEQRSDKDVVMNYLKDAIVATIEEAVQVSLKSFEEEFVLIEKEGWKKYKKYWKK